MKRLRFPLALLFFWSVLPALPGRAAAPVIQNLVVKGSPYLDVVAYRADKTGAVSIKSAFDNAVTAAVAGDTIFFSRGTYLLDNTVTISKNISVVMSPGAYILYTGTGQAIKFTAELRDIMLDLYVIRNPADWTAGLVGVEIEDASSCWMRFRVTGFEKGVYLHNTVSGHSIGFNDIFIRELFANRYNLYFHLDGGTYINANRIFGGRINSLGSSGMDNTLDRYGVYFAGAGTTEMYGLTIELAKQFGTGKSYAYFFDDESKFNHSLGAYGERADYLMGVSGSAKNNFLQTHYSDNVTAKIDTVIYEDNTVAYPGTNIVEWTTATNISLSKLAVQDVFGFSNIINRVIAVGRDGADSDYHVSGFTWLQEGGATFYYSYPGAGGLREHALNIDFQLALGRKIDTTYTKRFWLSVERQSDALHNVVVVPFDNTGARLDNTASTVPVTGYSPHTNDWTFFAYNTGYGGCYLNGGARDFTFINVSSAVKSIWVGVAGSEPGGVDITGISVKVEGNQSVPASSPGYDLVAADTYNDTNTLDLGSSVSPVGGMLSLNARVYSDNGAVGDPSGWFITDYHETTANGGEPAAETVVAANSATGIDNGAIMGVIITADSGGKTKWWWTTCTVSASNLTMANAVPTGYTIADEAKIITYVPKAMANI